MTLSELLGQPLTDLVNAEGTPADAVQCILAFVNTPAMQVGANVDATLVEMVRRGLSAPPSSALAIRSARRAAMLFASGGVDQQAVADCLEGCLS